MDCCRVRLSRCWLPRAACSSATDRGRPPVETAGVRAQRASPAPCCCCCVRAFSSSRRPGVWRAEGTWGVVGWGKGAGEAPDSADRRAAGEPRPLGRRWSCKQAVLRASRACTQ